MAIPSHPEIAALRKEAQVLVDAVSFDDNGAMIAGVYMGGNGGLLSVDTRRAADVVRKRLLSMKAEDGK